VKIFLPLLAPLLFLLACQPSSDNHQQPHSNDATARYWRMSGFIGDEPIVMDLNYRASLNKAYQAFHGSYYRLSNEIPVDFYGQLDSNNTLILNGSGPNGENVSFSGKLNIQNATFSGNFLNEMSGLSLPFRLKEDYADKAIPFTTLRLETKSPLFPTQPDLAAAELSTLWLLPNASDKKLNQTLLPIILNGMAGQSIAQVAKNPQQAFDSLSVAFLSNYNDFSDGATLDDAKEWPSSYAYENNISTEIIYNHNQLLTLGFWFYEYSGGAHGYYSTTLQTIDLPSGKIWSLNDIFSSTNHPAINIALEKAARRKFQLRDDEPLSSVLMEDTIPMTNNVGLTGKGVLCYYSPYEIAAYGVGEIKLFIPFTEVSEALTTKCKERFSVR
jgi:hypothetical protein